MSGSEERQPRAQVIRLSEEVITRDQLTMLEDGNTAEPDDLAALIKREPKAFSPDNLDYLDG